MSNQLKTGARGGMRRLAAVLMTAGLVSGLAACDSLLEVELPGTIEEDALNDPELIDIMVNSVVADFECAYNNYNFGAAVHSDEMIHSTGNLVQRRWGQRKITPDFDNYVDGSCSGDAYGMWAVLHTARFQAEDVYRRINEVDGIEDGDAKLATVLTYGGFTYTYFGETFCELVVDGDDPMTPAQVLEIAEDRFAEAIPHATTAGNESLLNAARIGLARVHLSQGEYAEARQMAELVPPGFVFNATRGSDFGYRENKAFVSFNNNGNHTVAPDFRDLEWKGVPDSRVNIIDTGRLGLGTETELWISDKWPSRETPVPIATWEEAQLIVAEAAANTGDPQTAEDIINALHTLAGLPGYDRTVDGDLMEHIIQERSRELFQEGGHRLHDMLRFGLPFFTGVDHEGETYGDTTCFPLPLVES